MPFYDYKCDKCGQIAEVLHGMGEKPVDLKCENCGSGKFQRVFYPVGLMVSGGASPGHSHSSGGSCSSCSSGTCDSCSH